jgi:glucosamine--fructose-6-phosphate aminotransferase (isomerizing)
VTDTRLELELREQPEALERLIREQGATAKELAALLRRRDVRYLLIASRGSSSNVARYAQYLLGRANRVPVAFATPSLYTLYEQPPRLDGALVIGISQSGESPDVRAVIDEARRQGRPTIAITNRPESPIAAAADAVLPLEAGEERAVAATKTYANSLGAIALLFAWSTRDRAALRELELMPGRIAEQLERSFEDASLLDSYGGIHGGTVVARGINYGTAFEVALKIRELSGLLFEAWSAADLMHGPVAAIAPDWPVIALAPSGPAAPDWPVIALAPSGPALASMRTVVDGLVDRGARVAVVADDPEVLAQGAVPLRLVEGIPEWLSPLATVIPGQVTAFHLAQLNGSDLDNPHGLSKVTLTL